MSENHRGGIFDSHCIRTVSLSLRHAVMQ